MGKYEYEIERQINRHLASLQPEKLPHGATCGSGRIVSVAYSARGWLEAKTSHGFFDLVKVRDARKWMEGGI